MSTRLLLLRILATVLALASASGCSPLRPAAPWSGLQDEPRAGGDFGALPGDGPPAASPSWGERVASALPFGEEEFAPDAPPSRSLPPVDPQTGAMAQARLLERRGEDAAAQAAYELYIQKYPLDPAPHHRLGILAARRGAHADAEHHLQAARALAPPTAELLSDQGYLYYRMDRYAEAEATLREALAIDPRCAAAHNNLGLVLGIQGRYEESMTEFRHAVSEAEAHANVAYVMTQRGELEQAQKRYLFALQLDNTLRPAGKAVVQILERQHVAEQLASAQREVEKAPAGVPSNDVSLAAFQSPTAAPALPPETVRRVTYQAEPTRFTATEGGGGPTAPQRLPSP